MKYHVRRQDKEIVDDSLLEKILKTAQFVTVAMSKDNQPYLVSLSHAYDEERNCCYFHCAQEGKKLDYLRSNNTVWGQALLDHGYSENKCDHRYASVHFLGKVHFLENPDEKRRAMELMMRQLDRNPEQLITALDHERFSQTLMGRIDIEYMSGKKSKEVTL